MNPLTLSPEVWAAIAIVVTPIVAAFASNIKLSSAVKLLTVEMKEVKVAITSISTHENRLLRLENPGIRRQRARK